MKAVFVEGIRYMAESIGLNWLFIPIRKKRLVAAKKKAKETYFYHSVYFYYLLRKRHTFVTLVRTLTGISLWLDKY